MAGCKTRYKNLKEKMAVSATTLRRCYDGKSLRIHAMIRRHFCSSVLATRMAILQYDTFASFVRVLS